MNRPAFRGTKTVWRLLLPNVTILILLLLLLQVSSVLASGDVEDRDIVTIKVSNLPDITQIAYPTIDTKIAKAVLNEFYKKYPYIKVESSTGLQIEGRGMDIVPLMQIAGNIAPDVLYVNFRQSDTYIQQEFLYPLDEFVGLLSREERDNVPETIWPVIKRQGPPDGQEHVYAWPTHPMVRVVFYNRSLFREAGLPDRTPDNWDEFMEFARKLTDPQKNTYGFFMSVGEAAAYDWMTFLWSAGGEAVVQDEQGNWRCVFDSDEAAKAALFYTKLFYQTWIKEYEKEGRIIKRKIRGVVYSDLDYQIKWDLGQLGMVMDYLDFNKMTRIKNPDIYGIGPPPAGPSGIRGSELNSRMLGIYNGVTDPKVREAAWKYISFWMSTTAQKTIVETMVESGYGQFAQPDLLEKFGYHEYVRMVPPSWKKVFKETVKNGKPEPYGKNCQQIYAWMTKPLGQIRYDKQTLDAIERGDDETALVRIKQILVKGTKVANEKMLGVVPPEVKLRRNRVAILVIVSISIIFALVLRHTWRLFSSPQDDFGPNKGKWQFRKYKIAYLCLIPAVLTIAVWQYYPLARGALMAFQDYRVTGKSTLVGLENFAEVLYDNEFWFSMWIAIKYSILYMMFGFTAPILLAILLQEVPKGKILFRTIYYLPAVVSGLVVIFLWKSFYQPNGLLNQIFGLFGLTSETNWLQHPKWALVCCLAPVIWAGMGPGCLIYLAALKTIPDELYEAASIDGAGIRRKIFHITLPSIKSLILINFIGVFIASFQSASSFVLGMTGGGPYSPRGETEVVGLHIYYKAFFYLKFGMATAMAWILGMMLIGFTVIQLNKLRNMEFRTAD